MRFNLFLAAGGFLTNFFLFLKLPRRVPLHFGMSGRVDRWGSKLELLGLNLFLVLFLLFLYFFIPRIDPKRRRLWSSRGYHMIFTGLFVLPFFLALLPYFYFIGLPVSRLALLFSGLVLAFIGNYLPTIRPNYFVGIRTPWTLENEEVWRKTHRIGGWLFVFTGLALTLSAIFLPVKTGIYFLVVLISLLILFLFAYSYRVWRREGGNGPLP